VRTSSGIMMRRTRDKGGPSPWVPATILGVVLIIAVLPYMALPQPPVVYQKSPSFPLPLLLIVVVLFVLAQWFSGPPSFGRSYSQGNRSFSPGAPRRMVWPQQQQQQRAWPWSRPGGYGQWDANDRYAGYNQSWTSDILRSFMDYSGHWLLILLGFALFAMVGSG
jgi:hypothetical protein